jgi:hypothetical protein
MTDERGPVFRRARSQHDRDVLVRKDTPAKGIPTDATPEFICDDPTGVYSSDPDKLRAARARRSTAERLEHLEAKYDALVHKTIDSRTKIIVAVVGAVAAMAGYLLGGCV